jgi:hypothetical protein
MNDPQLAEVIKRLPSFRPSADALRLFQYLDNDEAMPEGKIAPYSELNVIANRDVQRGGRGILYTALRMCLHESGKLFAVIPKVGYVRLRNEEKLELPKQRIGRIRTQAHRGRREIASINYKELPHPRQIEHNVMLSVLGALEHFSRPRAAKQLMDKATETGKAVPVAQLVELFNANRR